MIKTKTSESIQNMSANEIAIKYEPLVNKVAAQINHSTGYSYDDCVGAGRIGLIYAINNYRENEGKKKQTFTQYAAYMIRFYILNDVNQHGHVIRVNQDQQKKLKAEGKSVELTTSIDKVVGHDEDGGCTLSNIIPGDTESSIYNAIDPSEDDVWNIVYSKLNKRFSKRDLDVFYSTFGINGHEEIKGKDIAEKYGITAGAVTQIRNKIVAFMKADKELRNALLDILQMLG